MKLGRNAAIALVTALFACGSRPGSWSDPVDFSVAPIALTRGVVVLDPAQNRAVVLTAGADQDLSTRFLPVGHGGITASSSPDGERLFVLSGGDAQTPSGSSQPPMLTVIPIDAATFAPSSVTYPMRSPLGGLAIDPSGQWAVAYAANFASGTATNTPFVQDPNQLVLFDLSKPNGHPTGSL